jgi:hypothetical protein
LKRLVQIAFLGFFLFAGLSAMSQSADKSRLNIGVKQKKNAVQALSFKTPNSSLNSNLKSSLSTYYRSKLIYNSVNTDQKAIVSTPVEKSVEKVKVSNIYPNPASTYATIDVDINGKFNKASLNFVNMLGKSMTEVEILQNTDKIKVNVVDWESGIYLYQLTVDGRKLSTKKLLVSKN